jgi:hypothetical protein
VPNHPRLDSFESDFLSQGLYLPDDRLNKYLEPVHTRMPSKGSICHLGDLKKLCRPHQRLSGPRAALLPPVLSNATELDAQRKWEIQASEARQRYQ